MAGRYNSRSVSMTRSDAKDSEGVLTLLRPVAIVSSMCFEEGAISQYLVFYSYRCIKKYLLLNW